MAEQRNRSPEDVIYYFQQNYLHNLRRKTHQQINQHDSNQIKIMKSNSTHIAQPINTAHNLFDAYMKERHQKRELIQLHSKPQSKSSKQLNQILINNRQLIKRHRIASIQQQPEKSLEQLITRKKSTNITICDLQQKKIVEKCDWLVRTNKQVHIDPKKIKQVRHETVFRETFNRINGWQIENEYDPDF